MKPVLAEVLEEPLRSQIMEFARPHGHYVVLDTDRTPLSRHLRLTAARHRALAAKGRIIVDTRGEAEARRFAITDDLRDLHDRLQFAKRHRRLSQGDPVREANWKLQVELLELAIYKKNEGKRHGLGR